ncbi:MAG: isoprenylcysteine carboxylmethyltransferase family protein [Acetobacteraceae bacterium]
MSDPNANLPPNRIPWPPLIVLGTAAAAFVLTWLLPVPADFLRVMPVRLVGFLVLAAGLGFDIMAVLTMARQRANVLPHRAATALVTTGPFSLSRNPIYLGNTLVLAGFGLAFAAPWFIAAAAAEAWLVTWLAIRREEAHMADRFGAAWEAYARRTKRWFGWSGSG